MKWTLMRLWCSNTSKMGNSSQCLLKTVLTFTAKNTRNSLGFLLRHSRKGPLVTAVKTSNLIDAKEHILRVYSRNFWFFDVLNSENGRKSALIISWTSQRKLSNLPLLIQLLFFYYCYCLKIHISWFDITVYK